MKLDRNINANGMGKYGLVLQRRRAEIRALHPGAGGLSEAVEGAIQTLVQAGVIDWGNTIDSEFMVIRLKDQFAAAALATYALAAGPHDGEYAAQVMEMAVRAGPAHPNCKRPD